MSFRAVACDVCSCSSSNNSIGLLPNINKHFIGFRYQTNHYYSLPHESGDGSYSASNEYFKSTELFGRVSFLKRFQLIGFVPYKFNNRINSTSTINLPGFGDASILVNYQLLKPNNEQKFQHNLFVGAGLKLPTGKYDALNNYLFVNENIQLGTGSYDFPVSLNYTIRKQKTGMNVESSYKVNSVNKQHFQFGNKFNSSVRLFYSTTYKKLKFIPQTAFSYEQNTSNLRNGVKEEFTNGYLLNQQVGLDIYYKKFGVNFQTTIPIKNNYGEGHIQNKSRFSTQLIYLF